MLIVGLVGGVASGKSRVARFFENQGAFVLDGDRVGHQILKTKTVKEKIHTQWGDDVFHNGEVDRRRLAKLVFDESPDAKFNLEYLEKIVHPEIRVELLRQIEQARQRGKQIAILDAPVLIKAGWDRLCDVILFVDVPRDKRLQRATERDWTESMFDQREKAQTPLEKKREIATCFLDNSGEWSETERALIELWNGWLNDIAC